MALSDTDIRKLIRLGKIRFEPSIADSQIGAGSVDLTLDSVFWKFKRKLIGKKLDLSKVSFEDAMEKTHAKSVSLAPGEMCLGITKEKVTLAPDIMGRLEGRSRYARMGLAVHVTSALVQPGSANHQVLEIVNLSPSALTVHEGMHISQIVFERCESPTSKPYSKFGKIARKQ